MHIPVTMYYYQCIGFVGKIIHVIWYNIESKGRGQLAELAWLWHTSEWDGAEVATTEYPEEYT